MTEQIKSHIESIIAIAKEMEQKEIGSGMDAIIGSIEQLQALFKPTPTVTASSTSPSWNWPSKEAMEEVFQNALCDGMHYFGSYGIELSYENDAYLAAKEKLKEPAYEDVLMQILRDGGTISLVDTEGGQPDGIWTLDRIYQMMPSAPKHTLGAMIKEDYDACDADTILQYIAYGEVIFG